MSKKTCSGDHFHIIVYEQGMGTKAVDLTSILL